MAKRRVGLGFTGLGDALVMLRQRYDSDEARATGARIAEAMRDNAYRASVELARERGPFPLFNADLYLSGTSFAARLPEEIKELAQAGIRNRTAVIAPTADFARVRRKRQRHRPAFSGVYREKGMPDGTLKEFPSRTIWRLPRDGGDTTRWQRMRHRARIGALSENVAAAHRSHTASRHRHVPRLSLRDFEDLYLAGVEIRL